MNFEEIVKKNPVLATVKIDDELEKALQSDGVQIIVVLYGTACTIPKIVKRIKATGKYAIVHADLIEGLGDKEIVVDYLKQVTQLDGIISTKQSIIRRGIELGIFTILRCFVLDTKSFENLQKWLDSGISPDVVELMPGVAFKVIRLMKQSKVTCPIMVGGLIMEEWEVREALSAGAVAVSTSNYNLWFMYANTNEN